MQEIIAKAGMRKDEIIDRLERDADTLEIQLLSTNSDAPEMYLQYADKIHAIHTTLDSSTNRNVNFEDMDVWATENMEDAFRLAQFFSEEKRMVGVVMHLHTGCLYLERHHMFNPAFLRLEMMLKKYPNTYVLIENAMLASHGIFGPGFNSREFSNCVRKIRNMSSFPDRVFSIIDTTHAKSSAIIESQVFREKLWTDIYESWFRDSSDTIKEIHLSNCINLGLKREEHSVDFNAEDIASREFFGMSMEMIKAYAPESNICIDVSEKDYLHAEHFSHIYDMIKKYKVKAA